ncbi:MAG: hypothetical protein IT328_23150 [Caldilineaceae bacterium]|nr:hypothetical protein [Caldilineaceae bacterium]
MTFVNMSLATRLEDAQAWRAVYYAQASQAQTAGEFIFLTIAGAPVIYGGPDIPVNRAIGLGMHGPVTAGDLDAVESFYNERRADSVIDLCPFAHPSLLALLQTRPYHLRNWMSMLYVPLPSASIASNPAIRVTRATPDQAGLWLATSARGFDESDQVAGATMRVLTPNFYAANAHCYFAWITNLTGEIPIATGGMYPHNGVIELGGASTLLAYRQQGAQTALIQQRLHDAYAQGCDLAAVLTTPGSASQRNMQRRGFQLAYTRAIAVRPYTT